MTDLHIVLIDDEIILTQGLQSLIESQGQKGVYVEGMYNNYDECMEKHINKPCNLIIGDIDIDNHNLTEVIPTLKKKFVNTRVIILTNYDSSKLVRDMMKSGADGYILKKSSFAELVYCIGRVLEGEAFIGRDLQLTPTKKLFPEKEEETPEQIRVRKYEDKFFIKQKLTKRELEILKLIALAKSNKEIGSELFISDQTVGVHKKNIMRKLNVRSTINLIKYAVEQNLV